MITTETFEKQKHVLSLEEFRDLANSFKIIVKTSKEVSTTAFAFQHMPDTFYSILMAMAYLLGKADAMEEMLTKGEEGNVG